MIAIWPSLRDRPSKLLVRDVADYDRVYKKRIKAVPLSDGSASLAIERIKCETAVLVQVKYLQSLPLMTLCLRQDRSSGEHLIKDVRVEGQGVSICELESDSRAGLALAQSLVHTTVAHTAR